MMQFVYIPYDKSYKVNYIVNGSQVDTTFDRIFVNEVRTSYAPITPGGNNGVPVGVTPGLTTAAIAAGFTEKYGETTVTAMKALATTLNHTLYIFESGQSTITVHAAQNTAAEFLTYTIGSQVGSTTINSAAGTIALTMPNGTNVTALVATFTKSTAVASVKVGVTAQTSASTANNFTSPVAYVITSEHGETKTWTVTVTVAPS